MSNKAMEEESLLECEVELIHSLAKIWKDYEFVYGVSCLCTGEKASKAMLDYIACHPQVTSSEVTEYATVLCDKYNPQMREY